MSLLKAVSAAEPGQPLVHVDSYTPSMKGKVVCPQCNGDVIAKMGFKNIHHFAHKAKTHCDSWTESMTAWHKGWQDLFKPEHVEVIMASNGVKHVADVSVAGHILEVQHSPISRAEVEAREHFYSTNGKSLTWIVDGRSDKDCVVLGEQGDYAVIWARRSWWFHASLVLIDTEDGLFRVQKYSDKSIGVVHRVYASSLGTTWGYFCHLEDGLTLSGWQHLRMQLQKRCRRTLTTSFTPRLSVPRPSYKDACSVCTIMGDTYPHKELLKMLGMQWNGEKWQISHGDYTTRATESWHKVARELLICQGCPSNEYMCQISPFVLGPWPSLQQEKAQPFEEWLQDQHSRHTKGAWCVCRQAGSLACSFEL